MEIFALIFVLFFALSFTGLILSLIIFLIELIRGNLRFLLENSFFKKLFLASILTFFVSVFILRFIDTSDKIKETTIIIPEKIIIFNNKIIIKDENNYIDFNYKFEDGIYLNDGFKINKIIIKKTIFDIFMEDEEKEVIEIITEEEYKKIYTE